MTLGRLRTGHALSPIGFGGAQLGNLAEAISDEEAQAAVDAAWHDGIRYFDTAPHYGLGLSERRLGAALRERPRDEYVVSTKVGRLLVPSPETADRLDDDGFVVPASTRRVFDFSRDGILRSLEASLDRLGLDRIDIAYLHDPDEHWASASSTGVETLLELREQGVLGAVGVGMNQTPLLTRFIEETDVDVVMVAGRATLLDQSAFSDVLPAARERGVAVVAAGVFNSGILSSATVSDLAAFDYGRAPAEIVDRARRIAEICQRHGALLPAAALQFAARPDVVEAVVVGMRYAQHVHETIARATTDLDAQLWSDLARQGLIPAGS